METVNESTVLENEPKKRGRPATGKAMTAAERQAKKRRNLYHNDKENVNIWIGSQRKFKLKKLAEMNGLTLDEMIEKLIYDADLP